MEEILFSKGISPKVYLLAQPEFEITYYDVTVRHVSHYTTGTPYAYIT